MSLGLFPETTPLFPVHMGGYPPERGGVHVLGKGFGFNLVPGNKAYATVVLYVSHDQLAHGMGAVTRSLALLDKLARGMGAAIPHSRSHSRLSHTAFESRVTTGSRIQE